MIACSSNYLIIWCGWPQLRYDNIINLALLLYMYQNSIGIQEGVTIYVQCGIVREGGCVDTAPTTTTTI